MNIYSCPNTSRFLFTAGKQLGSWMGVISEEVLYD